MIWLLWLYGVGVVVALVIVVCDISPLEVARQETSTMAAGWTFILFCFVCVILAAAWPVVLALLGLGWIVGTGVGLLVKGKR
jgi:hypothetical protein